MKYSNTTLSVHILMLPHIKVRQVPKIHSDQQDTMVTEDGDTCDPEHTCLHDIDFCDINVTMCE